MLKKLHLTCSLLLPLFTGITFAQVPTGYYSSAEQYAGEDLKYQLNQIIDYHFEFSYTSDNTDVWDILKDTDRDPDNPNNVILIYSGVSVNAAQEYNEGAGWTREHIWSKSRGDFGKSRGPGTDVHALRPLDTSLNSKRNNRAFDECVTCEDVYDLWGNYTGSKRDKNLWTFEPRDEVKGDVARMLFYMAVRYEGYDGYPDLELTETIYPVDNKLPFHGKLSILLEWHRNDPVDAWEENRNDIIYYNYQNNRNPFIDHPELVEHLWGNKTGIAWQQNATLSVSQLHTTSFKVYPNPASHNINIAGLNTTTILEIYDTLGRRILTTEVTPHNNTINVSQLQGTYIIQLTSNSTSVTKRIIIT